MFNKSTKPRGTDEPFHINNQFSSNFDNKNYKRNSMFISHNNKSLNCPWKVHNNKEHINQVNLI